MEDIDIIPNYVIYNPSNSIVFSSPHLDHISSGVLPPLKCYYNEKKISIKQYKIKDKSEVLTGEIEYHYDNGNLVRCFIRSHSELAFINNCKYEVTNDLITCEKSFSKSNLIRETYFEYNNMNQIILQTFPSYRGLEKYNVYKYSEDKLISQKYFVHAQKLNQNDWLTKEKINYESNNMSSIENISKDKSDFSSYEIFLYDVSGNINKINGYAPVQSRQTGEWFPNWLQVEKFIDYDDNNRVNKFNYIFNEPHPDFTGTGPKLEWKYIFSYEEPSKLIHEK